MRRKLSGLIAFAAIATLVLAGCGSNRGSDGSTSAPADQVLANAEPVGITNCLTCHSETSVVTSGWLASRHANNLTAADKEALNAQNGVPDYENDPEPNYPLSDTCQRCHDQLGDGGRINLALVGQPSRPIVSCESCHGGGQFHNGIPAGIPFPTPGPVQCGQCHGVTMALFHSGVSDGNNVRRNITDTHDDNEATPTGIEGYNVKVNEQTGCVDCHYSAHSFDLTINDAWAKSAHGGQIKTIKDDFLTAQLADPDGLRGADLLAAVKAVPVESTGDAWVHYDWDAQDRQSCQRCHTTTGLKNFLIAQINDTEYDPADNDFSYLTGWSKAANGTVTSSGENEMLYCWGCHSDSTGSLRNPGSITLDFTYLVGPDQNPSGEESFVVLPDRGNSNVCAACHSGRGNDTSIRSNYADALANNDAPGHTLSSRFAGHHAPTAGSLYAAVTHTGFEFTDATGLVLDYSTPGLLHDDINANTDGPCASCHMGGPEAPNHLFDAVTEDASGDIIAINNQALCDQCHGGGINPAFLNSLRTEFDASRQILLDLVSNTIPNYKGLSISASANRNTATLALNDFGSYQNSLYMTEEPCIRIHNDLYGRRLMFDSIDWLEDGVLNGTIANYGAGNTWVAFGGTARP